MKMKIIIILLYKLFFCKELNFDIQGRNFALTYLNVGTPSKKISAILSTNTDKLIFFNIPGTISYGINSSYSVKKTNYEYFINYPYINNNYNITFKIVEDLIFYKNENCSFYFGYSNDLNSIEFAKEIRFPELGIIGISKNNDLNDKFNFINQLIKNKIIDKKLIYFQNIKNGTTFRNIQLGVYPNTFNKSLKNNQIFECKIKEKYISNRICIASRIIFGKFNSTNEFFQKSIKINEKIDFTYNTNIYHIFPLKYKEMFDRIMNNNKNCSYIKWYYYNLWSCKNKEQFPKISLVINHTIINMHNILFEKIGNGFPALIILFKDNIDQIELSVQQMTYKGFSVLFDDENNIIKFSSNDTKDIVKIDYDYEDYTQILLLIIVVMVLIVIIYLIFNTFFNTKKISKYQKFSNDPTEVTEKKEDKKHK